MSPLFHTPGSAPVTYVLPIYFHSHSAMASSHPKCNWGALRQPSPRIHSTKCIPPAAFSKPFPSIKSARGKENIRSFLLMQDKSPAIRYIIHPLHNTDIILQDDKFYNFTYLQNVYWVFSFIPDSDLNGTPSHSWMISVSRCVLH